MSRLVTIACWAMLSALLASPLGAEVGDSDATGFTTKLELKISAPPQEVYKRLVHNVGNWWDPAHSYSHDSQNLSIDDRAMGCFCEKLPSGGGVRHFEVVNVDPGKKLVMTGGMGPLQTMAVTGNMTIQLVPADGATNLSVVYASAGYVPGGMNTLAPVVDSVITELFTRLKNFVETGKPVNEKAAPK